MKTLKSSCSVSQFHFSPGRWETHSYLNRTNRQKNFNRQRVLHSYSSYPFLVCLLFSQLTAVHRPAWCYVLCLEAQKSLDQETRVIVWLIVLKLMIHKQVIVCLKEKIPLYTPWLGHWVSVLHFWNHLLLSAQAQLASSCNCRNTPFLSHPAVCAALCMSLSACSSECLISEMLLSLLGWLI